MSKNHFILRLKSTALILMLLFLSNILLAQTDSTQVVQTDTKPVEEQKEKKQKKDRKRKDEFKVFAGVNFNQLSIDEGFYKSELSAGYLLGASYKRGRFFYWEVGARFNNPVYSLTPTDSTSFAAYSDGLFSIRSLDVPITVGINFLSITSRIVGLRIFLSAVPTFPLGIGGNDIGISMDNINTFNFYGQGGVGLDVTFLFLEAGFNYGFSDLIKNDVKSNPYQGFVTLGFRF